MVDANVDRKKTRAAAEAYLKFLYTPEAQEIIAAELLPAVQARDPAQVLEVVSVGRAVPDSADRRAAGTRPTSGSSPTAACSTRFTVPEQK